MLKFSDADFYTTVIHEGDVTIASVDLIVADRTGRVIYEREFSANAKRSPEDKLNSDASALIALGRALDKAARALDSAGNGLIKHDIDVIAEKSKQAAKPKKRVFRGKKK